MGLGQKYKRVYFPNTTINGLDVSGLTPEEIKDRITAETSGYTLTLQERGGASEVISGSDIGFHPEFDGTLEQILNDRVFLHGGFILEGMWITQSTPWLCLMKRSFLMR